VDEAVDRATVGFVDPPKDPAKEDSLFFASATALVTGAFVVGAADRVDAGPLVAAVFATVGLADVAELIDEVGFRAEAAEDVAVFDGDPCVEDARDVLLTEVVDFFSSVEEMDGVGLWLELEAVGAVALLAVLRTVEPAIGRVGGLLNPPVVRVVEEEVPLVADDAGKVPGRLAPMTVRFGAAFSF